MKKTICTLLVATMLVSSTANAGIMILTGQIGNKFNGYKTVGWLTIILTGISLVGLVVDANDQVNANVQIPELSEASLALIENATAEARAQAEASKTDIMTSISPDLASQIVSLEGLEESAAGNALFHTLTTK